MVRFRGCLDEALRRRGVRIAVVAYMAAMMLHTYVSYGTTNTERSFLAELDRGTVSISAGRCTARGCTLPNVCTAEGESCMSVGLSVDQLQTVQRAPAEERDTRLTEAVRASLVQDIQREEEALALRKVLRFRAATASAAIGVFFAVVVTATLLGAEWRWRTWLTALAHEPRRGRLLVAKLLAAWTVIAVSFIVAIAAASMVDVVVQSSRDMNGMGGPSLLSVAGQLGVGVLTMGAYAAVAAVGAITFRSSLAALLLPLVFVVADGLVTGMPESPARYALPVQQVVGLTEDAELHGMTRLFWFAPTPGKEECRSFQGFAEPYCSTPPVEPNAPVHSVAVLVGWSVLGTFGAARVLSWRDVD